MEQRPEKQASGDGRVQLIMQPSHLERQIIRLRIKAANKADFNAFCADFNDKGCPAGAVIGTH